MSKTAPNIAAGNLDGLDHVRHAFFGSQGGVSEGIFSSLNCGLGSTDDADAVRENRRRAAAAFDATPDQVFTAFQIHSSDVVRVDEGWEDDARPKIDGMVTNKPGRVLGILTADCAPVLFADTDARVIGACHAGWKGAIGGVCEETIQQMVALGATRDGIRAAVGPTITQTSYEVGPEFGAPFIAEDPANERFFIPGKAGGKAQFDLPGYVVAKVKGMGVRDVIFTGQDTCSNPNTYFSYRRSCHRGEPDYGRNLSAIMLEE